jgi:hypothetical protein
MGVSSLGLTLGTFFLEGPHLPLGGMFGFWEQVMLLEVPPSLGELTLQELLNPLVVQI